MGRVHIKTIKGSYLVDDLNIDSDLLSVRRLRMEERGDKVYKFRAKIDNLRQLVKYPSGTLFMDKHGTLFRYKKGKKQYNIESKKILKKEEVPEGLILHIEGIPSPHIIYYKRLADNIQYASVMYTDYGPLVYDYTAEKHKVYRRSI